MCGSEGLVMFRFIRLIWFVGDCVKRDKVSCIEDEDLFILFIGRLVC